MKKRRRMSNVKIEERSSKKISDNPFFFNLLFFRFRLRHSILHNNLPLLRDDISFSTKPHD